MPLSFSPETDLNTLQALLLADSQILTHLGLTSATQVERVKHILKRSIWTDLANNEKRLCCYFRPSRTSRLSIVTNEVLQVDCHVPAAQDYIAYRTIARVEKLLYDQQIGNRIYEFEGQLGELPSATGFICVGARFTFYAIK